MDAEYLGAIFWSAISEFSAATQAAVGVLGCRAQGRESELSYNREVSCRMPFANATGVLAESHVKYPVHDFNTPVGAL